MPDAKTEPTFYRKKALIKATQWNVLGDHPAVTLLPINHPAWNVPHQAERLGWIETLEGGFVVHIGDWIATGIQGEHYAIKPDIFAETYEVAPSPVVRGEWPDEREKFLKIIEIERKCSAFYAENNQWLEGEIKRVRERNGKLAEELALRPPSPPAVVGDWIEGIRQDFPTLVQANGQTVDWDWIDNNRPAPTPEPPATVDDESRGYARGIEAAAVHAASFPAHQCGHLPSDPFECAAQVKREIAAGIRTLLPAPSEGVK